MNKNVVKSRAACALNINLKALFFANKWGLLLKEDAAMAKQCDMCGKTPQVGNMVSHSNRKTKRIFSPNLQSVRHQFENGRVATLTVCTRCIRSGYVIKPAANKEA